MNEQKTETPFNPEDAVNSVFLLYLQNELLLILNSINVPEGSRDDRMKYLVSIVSRNMSLRAQNLFPVAIEHISKQAERSGIIKADENEAKAFKEHFDKNFRG